MPKAIFFDLDDTLLWDKESISRAFEATCREVEAKYGIAPHVLEEFARQVAPTEYAELPTHSFTQQIGINPFEGLWGTFGDVVHHQFRQMGDVIGEYQYNVWFRALLAHGVTDPHGAKKLRERFRFHRLMNPVVYEETFEVLDALKAKGYRLLMLTNGAPSLQLEKLTLTPELVPYFEHIVISGNVGAGKPDRAVFDHSLRLMDLEAKDVLMVGDNQLTDIKGSRNIGMKNVWIDHHNQADQLKERFDDQRITRLRELLDLV